MPFLDSPYFSKRRIRRYLVLTGMIVVGWLLVSVGVVVKLTRRPHPPFAEPPPKVGWGILQPESLTTTDGQTLGAWYAEGKDDAPSILLLHGNGGSRWNVLSRAKILASEAGCTVLLVSLRAHGDSTGSVNDIGHSARRDVVAAVEFLRERRPGRPVIVLGVSMGSAAAIFAAEELGGRVNGYVLESPYQDLKTAVWNRTELYLPPVLNRLAYVGLRIVAPWVLPEFEAIAPIRAIDKIPLDVPILILSGGDDKVARPSEAFALFERVKSHATIEVIRGGGHHGLLEVDPRRYARLLLDFCNNAARGAERSKIGHPLSNRPRNRGLPKLSIFPIFARLPPNRARSNNVS